MTEPTNGDDLLRGLADDAVAARRRLLHRITTNTTTPATAVHYPRRALLQRLRDEWHTTTNPNENEENR